MTTPLDRLSFNQATAERASLPEVVEACARHEIPYVSLWRHRIAARAFTSSTHGANPA